jgi:E3 ubiquitin-protein ligase HERC2
MFFHVQESGEFGALGHGDVSDQMTPKIVEALEGLKVVDISAGCYHVLALTADGEVYAWGGNDNGQLGLGHTNRVSTPTKVDLPTKITKICAGSHHSFAFTACQDDSKLLPDSIREEYKVLEPVFNSELISRMKILNKYSEYVFQSLSLFNLTSPSVNPYAITFGIETTVGLLKFEEKLALLRRHITSTNTGDCGPVIRLNSWMSEQRKSRSLFYQACQQLMPYTPSELRQKRAWKVEFQGEGAIDAGGPYQESITRMCWELQNERVPIMSLTANGKNKTGYNQDCIVPVVLKSQQAMYMYQFLGRFMGISVRTNNPLNVKIAMPFWKSLLGHPLTIADLNEIDEAFVKSHQYVLEIEDEERFQILLDKFPPLALKKGKLALTFENRKKYVKWAFALKLKEWNPLMDEIRTGLGDMIPLQVLKLFTPREAEELVCGKTTIDWNLLRSKTVYSGYPSDHRVIGFLWEVLEEMAPEDGSLFIRFVWRYGCIFYEMSKQLSLVYVNN